MTHPRVRGSEPGPQDPAALPSLPPDQGSWEPGSATDLPRRTWVEQVMGMPVSFQVRGPRARRNDGPAPEAVRAAIADLHRTEEIFSPFRQDSQINRLRRAELTLADCDPWVREVATLCDQARERTDGWFDAYFPAPDGSRWFNPTGLVKGWAIERVTQQLAQTLINHDVLVNAGGDIAVRCDRTDTPDWVLGIENPADRSQILARVPLRTGAMATSGTAARGAHILDPRTGSPATALLSVTVIGPDLTWADVHATATFAMGPDGAEHLAGLADHLGYLVLLDGSTQLVRRPD